MKKFFKWLFVIILLLIIAAGGYYIYDNYIAKRNTRTNFSIVPSDAIFIIETSNLTDGWKAISESNVWNTLLKNQYFSSINEYAELLDEFLKNNVPVDMVLRDRPLLISSHMISGTDYDFLFIVDMQSAKTLSATFSDILKLVDGYEIKKRVYHGIQIVEFIDKANPGSIIYFAIMDNLLVSTFTGSLIERTIDEKDKQYWEKNEQYQEVSGELSSKKLFKFYFNYRKLPEFIAVYFDGLDEYTTSMANALTFSAFDVNLENNKLSFDGYSSLDSLPSYFSALCDVKPGNMKAYDIISDQAALYLSVGFKNYNIFFESLTNQYAKGNAEDMEDYSGNVKMVEKLLAIDVQKDFFDWIGEEITFVKLLPSDNSRLEDVVVAIHAKDINEAKEGLGRITKQIRRRSPVKFDVEVYKNFEINILERKGIFKLFFGKLFQKLEKPYFTYIEDYVIFSNSLDALKSVVDDYLKGHTLSHSPEFMDFIGNFDSKANVSLFIQMPKLYSNMYSFSNAETKNSLNNNKDLILSFNRIGFQLVADNDKFKTRLISDHNEDASLLDQLEQFEKKASDELFISEKDSLAFKIVLPDSTLKENKAYKAYYHESNQQVKFEGKISNNQLNGLWRSYYESGNLESAVNYKDGKINGMAYFYYDNSNETLMAEVNIKDDIIIGIYQEYYQNGAQKAKLNFEDGMLNGDAEFYYPTGRLKMEGKYKDNVKKGKWLFYNENGELINKEKMKKEKN